jgi:hypothetical protein
MNEIGFVGKRHAILDGTTIKAEISHSNNVGVFFLFFTKMLFNLNRIIFFFFFFLLPVWILELIDHEVKVIPTTESKQAYRNGQCQ